MKRTFATMAFLSVLTTAGINAQSAFDRDNITAKDGSQITITFYAHSSIAFDWNGCRIYVDPVGKNIDWSAEPKADLVLITHEHGDHLSVPTITTLNGTGEYVKLAPGKSMTTPEGVAIEAVPAYNTSAESLNFHPKERGDAGYIINLGGTRIYVAGDTEDNEDILSIKDIDIAFLPVNRPYTMTAGQCIHAASIIRPTILYPYHFSNSVTKNEDLEAIKKGLEGKVDVRVRRL